MAKVTITFEDKNFSPVEVEAGSRLVDHLDGPHSPVFFGCRSGNCGTCLIELDPVAAKSCAAPDDLEREYLDFAAPTNPNARLACQLNADVNMTIKYLATE